MNRLPEKDLELILDADLERLRYNDRLMCAAETLTNSVTKQN
jgi:hypothetical protein